MELMEHMELMEPEELEKLKYFTHAAWRMLESNFSIHTIFNELYSSGCKDPGRIIKLVNAGVRFPDQHNSE